MKYFILFLIFLFLQSCSKPKTVLICGDHICINRAEAEQYFEENLTIEVKIIDKNITSLIENKKNNYGSGGITTKLDAAKICMNSGCHMFIANGKNISPISNIIKNKKFTHFLPKISSLDAKKKWIISSLNSSGTINIDEGASKALLNGKSLLAAGVIRINGAFEKGENILILDQNNKQLARGLSSFTSEEIDKIKGKQSKEIEKVLGYLSKTEIIHKDDMVLL